MRRKVRRWDGLSCVPSNAPTDRASPGSSVDRLGSAIRNYLADLGNEQPLDDEQEGARAQEILSAVINLEHVSNILASSLTEFAVKKMQQLQAFSAAELEAIAAMHAELLESLRLAVTVFFNGDAGRRAARGAQGFATPWVWWPRVAARFCGSCATCGGAPEPVVGVAGRPRLSKR